MSDLTSIRDKNRAKIIFKYLKDEIRLTIFLCLMVNHKLTLKQLSEILNKGKTTVHHHIRRLEDEEIIVWEAKEADKRKLKTRYYSINYDHLQNVLGIETTIQ